MTLEDIRTTPRNRQPPEDGIMCELLWSDPQPLPGRSPSKRGVGCQFGPDVTHAFLAHNGLDYVVRSHEVKDKGYEEAHDGKCITVSGGRGIIEGREILVQPLPIFKEIYHLIYLTYLIQHSRSLLTALAAT